MTVNAQRMSATRAGEVLWAGWQAQKAGGLRTSWMLHGRPGVGKSELVRALAARLDAPLFDLRLTMMEPQDLRGLPFYDHEGKRTVWYRPEDLPQTGPAVLFLDELTAAPPMLHPAVYGLLQERRVGAHSIGEDVFLVAAGNGSADGAVAYDMGTALSDRMVHLVVEARIDDWLVYAAEQNAHPAVPAFLRARPDLLDTTEDALRKGQTVAATPRAWLRVSDILHSVSDRVLRHAMIAGTVGEASAAEVMLVVDEVAAALDVEEMFATARSKRKDLYPQTLNGLTALVFGTVSGASEQTMPAAIEIFEDIRHLDAALGLPLADLSAFGFERLIAKALDHGWEDAFAGSDAYADYAEARAAAGL
ncbi:ATP-binding protein [Pseudaestuariivita sp.]|uniref:ATP-binding protein n=1 Tax=Pseudaestuariivita sp. TaxID=2211669 RepID=UPI004059F054